MLLWAIVPALLVSAYMGKTLRTLFEIVSSCLGIVAATIILSWIIVWKSRFIGSPQDALALLALLAAIPLHVHALRLARFSNKPDGIAGVRAQVAKLLGLRSFSENESAGHWSKPREERYNPKME